MPKRQPKSGSAKKRRPSRRVGLPPLPEPPLEMMLAAFRREAQSMKDDPDREAFMAERISWFYPNASPEVVQVMLSFALAEDDELSRDFGEAPPGIQGNVPGHSGKVAT